VLCIVYVAACHFDHLTLPPCVFFYSAAFGKFDEGEEMARTVELLLRKPGMQRMKSRFSRGLFATGHVHFVQLGVPC
jgi:hypothetical protein